MFSFVFRRKQALIPEAYRQLDNKEAALVAGGHVLGGIWPGSGGQGALKDPNG